eukprot:760814-Hanusia_phi.AAC.1
MGNRCGDRCRLGFDALVFMAWQGSPLFSTTYTNLTCPRSSGPKLPAQEMFLLAVQTTAWQCEGS